MMYGSPMGPPMAPMGGQMMVPMGMAPMGMAPMMPMAQPMYMAPPPPPPVYYQPPPPPPVYYPPQQQQGPTIITVNNGGDDSRGSPCQTCGKNTDNIPRKKVGCVAIAWCLCLLFTVGSFGLCFIPLCSDGCKDTELICVKCQNIKSKIPANCC